MNNQKLSVDNYHLIDAVLITTVLTIAVMNYVAVSINLFPIDPQISPNSEEFLYPNSTFPEHRERAMYVFSILIAPILLGLYYFVLRKFLSGRHVLSTIVAIICVLLVILLIYFDLKSDPNKFTRFWLGHIQPDAISYIRGNLFPKIPLRYFVIGLPILLYLILRRYSGTEARLIKYVSAVMLTIILIGVFRINIFDLSDYPGRLIHFNAVFYPLTQVIGGKTILVDVHSQYGLFPHFLAPVFEFVKFSIPSYSILMSFINVFCLGSLIIIQHKLIKNPVITFLASTSLLFYSYILPRINNFDSYFQYHPLRMLPPVAMLILAMIYLYKPSKIVYCFILICLSFFVFWNLDTGLVALFSWMLFLCFSELENNGLAQKIKRIASHLASTSIAFVFSSLCVMFFLFARSGTIPRIQDMIKYQTIFYESGFYMIKMPLFNTWNLIALVYLIGLYLSFDALIKRRLDVRRKMYFLLSILGIGIFSYYQGRSHDLVLLMVSYPAVILTGCFVDDFVTQFHQKVVIRTNIVYFLIGCVFLTVPQFSVFAYPTKFIDLFDNQKFNRSDFDAREFHDNIKFIHENVSDNERILILVGTDWDGAYYAYSTTASASSFPGSSDLILKTDREKLINFISNNQTFKVFADRKNTASDINTILDNNYLMLKQNAHGFQYFIPKKTAVR